MSFFNEIFQLGSKSSMDEGNYGSKAILLYYAVTYELVTYMNLGEGSWLQTNSCSEAMSQDQEH